MEVSRNGTMLLNITQHGRGDLDPLLDWQGGPIKLKALHTDGATLGKVSKVELLGSDIPLTFVQDNRGLTVTLNGSTIEARQPQQMVCKVTDLTRGRHVINIENCVPGPVAVDAILVQ